MDRFLDVIQDVFRMAVSGHLVTIEIVDAVILRCDIGKDIFGISFIRFDQQHVLFKTAGIGTV